MAPIKNPPIPMGEDDHMVTIKPGENIDTWLASLNLATRMSRWARGCHPDTGERLSDVEFARVPEPKFRWPTSKK